MNSTIESIATSSLSLLSTLQAAYLESPIPPHAGPTTSQVLTSLRADLETLAATLAHAHTITVARRKAAPTDIANESAAAKAEREARLRERVDQLRTRVEQAREAGEIKRGAVDALNGAWVVEQVLKSGADGCVGHGALGEVKLMLLLSSRDMKAKLRTQLARKDEVALQLLSLRTKNDKAAAERARLRKRMFGTRS